MSSLATAVANLSRFRASKATYGKALGTTPAPSRTVDRFPLNGSAPAAPGPINFNPGAGSAPAAPDVNVGPNQLPPDATLDDQVRAYNNSLAQGQAQINNQITRVKGDYGYDDPSNPFNRAKMLQEAYQHQQTATTNNLASQGQLYSGYLGSTRDVNTTNFNKADAAQRQQYQDALSKLIQQRDVTLPGQANEKILAARNDALMRAIAAHQNDPGPQDQGVDANGVPTLQPGENAAQFVARLAAAGYKIAVTGSGSSIVRI